jgi:hypothetical protein
MQDEDRHAALAMTHFYFASGQSELLPSLLFVTLHAAALVFLAASAMTLLVAADFLFFRGIHPRAEQFFQKFHRCLPSLRRRIVSPAAVYKILRTGVPGI